MLTVADAETRWERTLHIYAKGHEYRLHSVDVNWDLYEWRRNSRLFAIGDIVLGTYTNGQAERLAVTGYSSKGFTVRNLIVPYQRWFSRPRHARYGYVDGRFVCRQPTWQRNKQPARYGRLDNRTPIFFVELPHPLRAIRNLSGLPVADADVRRFVVGRLRAADSARSVGASSGASP